MNDHDQILIPVIKDLPMFTLDDIMSCQPMTGPAGEVFKLKTYYSDKPMIWEWGTLIHEFIGGYVVGTGSECIPYDKFIKLYPWQRIKDGKW